DVPAHRTGVDDFPRNGHFNRRFLTLANDAEFDAAVDRTAHSLDRLGLVEALEGFVIDAHDEIAGANSGLGRRRVVEWRHHLDQTVFHRHFEPEPAKFAAVLRLHALVSLGVQIAGVRIKRSEHAI